MKNNDTSIGIIGLGAIGSYFALKMKLSGYNPILFTKESKPSVLNIIYREDGRIYSQQFVKGNPSENNSFDFLFITVKSYSIELVIKNYRTLINNSKRIILVQSNINLKEYDWGANFDKLYFTPILIGIIGDYRSIIFELNKGSILIGKLIPNTNNEIFLVKDLLSNIANVIISDDIEIDLFLKVIINT